MVTSCQLSVFPVIAPVIHSALHLNARSFVFKSALFWILTSSHFSLSPSSWCLWGVFLYSFTHCHELCIHCFVPFTTEWWHPTHCDNDVMCIVEHNEFLVYLFEIVFSILSVSNIHSVVRVNFAFGILYCSCHCTHVWMSSEFDHLKGVPQWREGPFAVKECVENVYSVCLWRW